MNKEQAALTVVGNMELDGVEVPQLSPILVKIGVEVLAWAIPKCAEWIMNQKKTAKGEIKPGLAKMLMLRRQVRRSFKAAGETIDHRKHGESFVKALLKTYNEATLDQVSALVNGA